MRVTPKNIVLLLAPTACVIALVASGVIWGGRGLVLGVVSMIVPALLWFLLEFGKDLVREFGDKWK